MSGATASNRLTKLFKDFALRNELPFKQNGDVFRLGIPAEGKLVHLRYTFDQSGDGYEFGTPLLKINEEDQPSLSNAVLHSKPIRGLTERIVGERFYVLGNRDGLRQIPDDEIARAFENDVARVSTYFTQLKGVLDDLD